ncbi:MAG TPA: hypothetical protein VEL76_28045 [Gemmataceae bacterium]|nr:hypothetical protein [Gemmataceae bacterium]
MTLTQSGLNRRGFLKAAAGGGFTLGGLLGFGLDLRAAQEEVRRSRIAGAREYTSVCPYCAVGCGQLVHVRGGNIINIEGNPDSPINQGTLCPKGAATFQLAVNDNRIKRVWYRAPGATDWDKTMTLDEAMRRVAQRVKETRDAEATPTRPAGFQETWWTTTPDGVKVLKEVNHTLRIASLGGATMDNEWNYLQCKLMRALGVVFIENQARI